MERYLLDRAKLQPGDIVLQAGIMPHSKAIMLATGGRYSHALLYDSNSMIEATLSGGVFSKNPQRVLVRNPAHLAVYRMRSPLNTESLHTVMSTARQKTAAPYAPIEAIGAAFRSRHSRSGASSGQFCSRLVAQSFSAAGIHLVPNADFCSPHELTQSPLLEQIYDVVRLATPEDLKIYDSVDINLRNQRATLRWVRRARVLAAKENQEIAGQSDVLKFLIDHPEHDDAVVECIRSTTYLSNFNHDRAANAYRYNEDAFVRRLVEEDRDSESFLRDEIGKELSLIPRYGRNLAAMRQHAHRGLSYVEEHILLYASLLAQIEERLKVILRVLSRIGSEEPGHAERASRLLQDVQAARLHIELPDAPNPSRDGARTKRDNSK
jgi:hypothetical protein